jgi:hypothetical protein
MMKWLITATLLLPLAAVAQNAPGGKTLASTLDVYVFPSKGQKADQQSQDESTCYQWAVSNSGVDPFQLQKQAQSDQQYTDQQMQQAQNSGDGRAAQGMFRGAAAGALIGGIADGHHGARHGAAWGAGLGLLHGARVRRDDQRQAEANAQYQGQARAANTAQDLDNFKKAFSVCLESKNYMVKY